MFYAVAADAVLIVHLAFIVLVVFGGVVSLRWPRFVWVHAPAALWGAYVSLAGRLCPLTPLEQTLRRAAGEQGYAGGFIDHYLLAIIYPEGLTREIQIAIGAGVILLASLLYVAINLMIDIAYVILDPRIRYA